MQPDFILLDADRRSLGGDLDEIALMYCHAGQEDNEDADDVQHETVVTGTDFFDRWLPADLRARYGTLRNYWLHRHARRRNKDLRAYLHARMPDLSFN